MNKENEFFRLKKSDNTYFLNSIFQILSHRNLFLMVKIITIIVLSIILAIFYFLLYTNPFLTYIIILVHCFAVYFVLFL